MNKFIKIFLFLEIFLFSYIFNSSIYSVYEKNNIIPSNLNGYSISSTNGDTLFLFYQEFTTEFSEYELMIMHNPISSTNKSIYNMYYYSLEKANKKNAVTASLEINYFKLEKEDFIDSSGIFYTDLDANKLEEISKQLGISIVENENESIPYSMIFKYNALNFIILFVVMQIIYCVYTSSNFKKIGIKQSIGFSNIKIIKEQLKFIAKNYLLFFMSLFFVQNCFYIFINRFSVNYLYFGVCYFIICFLVNIVCLINTTVLIKLINLENMIKNKTFNKTSNCITQIIKIVFSIIIAFTSLILFTQYKALSINEQNVLNYKYLDGYYTANGFNSEVYDAALLNKEKLEEYSNAFLNMYRNEMSLLCDSSALLMLNSSNTSNIPQYQMQYIVANKSYLRNFSAIKNEKDDNLDLDKIIGLTVLIPNKMKDKIDDIKGFCEEQISSYKTYNKYYKITTQPLENEEINYVFIGDESSIKVNTEEGFSDSFNNIIMVDNGTFDSLYYFDNLNNRNIFFKLDSRESFTNLLVNNGLEKIINSGTLLTPYLTRLEGTQFTLKTYSVFSIIFLVSLIFIIYISNYVDVFTNKKKYALKEILGFSHFRILKYRYLVFALQILISVIFSLINIYFSFLLLISIIDLIVCEILYNLYIKKFLYDIEKGA